MKNSPIPRRGAWTVDALGLLPQDGHTHEIIDGELSLSPPTDEEHNRVLWNMLLILMPFAKEHSWPVRVCPEPTSFSSRRHVLPDIVLSPNPVFAPTPLELIVEVTSPYTRRTDSLVKRELYQHERVWQYWIVDPQRRELVVWRHNDCEPHIVRDSYTFQGSVLRDPLRVEASDIFTTNERSFPDVSRFDLFPTPIVISDSDRATRDLWTVELLDTVRSDGCRHEIINGRLFVTPPHPPAWKHQCALIELRALLTEHADGLGVIVAMGPVNVELSPTTRVSPDFVAYHRLAGERSRRSGKTATPPCLIVEVVSEYSRALDTGAKRSLYQRMLVDEYWIVDLHAREVLRWTSRSQKPEVSRKTMTWHPVPGRDSVPIDISGFFGRALYRFSRHAPSDELASTSDQS